MLDVCTSTNDVAAQRANIGAPHGYTILSEEQTAGRGRQGRTWVSPTGGIWLTILLRPPFAPNSLNSLPIVAAIATAKTLNSNPGVRARIRWPNDIFVDDRKLAGILAETKFKGDETAYSLLGVGINANFHSTSLREPHPKATTLEDLLGSPVDREAIIARLLMELENIFNLASSNPNDAMVLLRSLDCSCGKEVRIGFQGEKISGIMDSYESFTKVRIRTIDGQYQQVETSSVVCVEYPNF